MKWPTNKGKRKSSVLAWRTRGKLWTGILPPPPPLTCDICGIIPSSASFPSFVSPLHLLFSPQIKLPWCDQWNPMWQSWWDLRLRSHHSQTAIQHIAIVGNKRWKPSPPLFCFLCKEPPSKPFSFLHRPSPPSIRLWGIQSAMPTVDGAHRHTASFHKLSGKTNANSNQRLIWRQLTLHLFKHH